MHAARLRLFVACLSGLLVLWPVSLTQAQPREAAQARPNQTPKNSKPAKPQAAKVKVAPGGSGETAAERTARLRRECKGRPNAGACSGYTD
jgi:hypothetical protein